MKKSIILTKKEVESIKIGLDTQDPNYIEEDSLDWFPIFVNEMQKKTYTAQFLKNPDEIYEDSRCKFKYKPKNKETYKYLTIQELSTLKITIPDSGHLFSNKNTTWTPMFLKIPDGLIYNPFIDEFDLTKSKVKIDINE